ncbi:unnamed protein product [Amoebophrya sp. A25]|nr:unnamed protein product [Amoebophrya sp. A25]|eukprot:GSA25T00015606001.1
MLHLFQRSGVLKQGRQLLILRDAAEQAEDDAGSWNDVEDTLASTASPGRSQKLRWDEPRNSVEGELMNWDKLLDLADRTILAEGGGFSREHVQQLEDDALDRLGKEVLTYPVVWSEVAYQDSVAMKHVFPPGAGDVPVVLASAENASYGCFLDESESESDSSSDEEASVSDGKGDGRTRRKGVTRIIDVLDDTWCVDVREVDSHSGLGGGAFVCLVDHELEGNFEHPAHLKYLKLQKAQAGEKEGHQGVLRPNAEELTKLNDILRRPVTRQYSMDEKLLLYKFRHSLVDRKEALIKFLHVVDWQDGAEKRHALELMRQWSQVGTDDALAFLSKDFRGVAEVRRYAVDRLATATDDELLGYLLQLVQALRYAPDSADDKDDKDAGEQGEEAGANKSGRGKEPSSGGSTAASALSSGARSPSKDGGALSLSEADPLLSFLIGRAQSNVVLATYFHWFLIAEIEASDSGQYERGSGGGTEGGGLFNAYIFVKARQQLLDTLEEHQPSFARTISDQITFRRKLLWAMRVAKAPKRQSIELKITKFQDALSGKQVADPEAGDRMVSKQFNVLDLPMIVDPHKRLLRIIPAKCFLIKSAMYPAVLHCEVREGAVGEDGKTGMVDSRKYMFKEGDDLRQDQLVVQMIILMDSIFKKYGLDLRLTPYKVIACSTIDGLIEFVPDARNLSAVLAENNNDLLAYFRSISRGQQKMAHSKAGYSPTNADNPMNTASSVQQHEQMSRLHEVDSEILDNFVRSCAGYCVITYILGIGDRHLDNLMVTSRGQMFHIDFGFILGKDPKPFPPPMKLCREMVDGMGGKDSPYYRSFLSNACEAFKILRRHQNLLLNLLYLMSDAGIKDISHFALSKLQEKFLPEMNDEAAESQFITLINESVNALFPQMMEKLHKWAVYWR